MDESADKTSNKGFAAKLYLAVWRWHFWMGLLIAPVLIVVSVTGAIYVFKAELERVMYPELMFTESTEVQTTGFDAFQAAVAEANPQHELRFVNISKEYDRAWEGFAEIHKDDGTEETIRYFYDAEQGELLGTLDNETSFFRVVLAIHRRLFAGTPGRIIVEATTCWGIISMLTGLWLWWPRGKEKVWGVWLPRVRGRVSQVLRDWHTVPGMYVSLFVLAIMFTGLLFTQIWGTGFRLGILVTGGFPDFFVNPPKSVVEEGADMPEPISIDDAAETAFGLFDFSKDGLSVSLPHAGTDEAIQFLTDTQTPMADRGIVILDQFSGETLLFETNEDIPWQTKFVLLFYPIHVGSIFGMTTKILAVLSCILLIAMSVTGVWMWWRRRPAGSWGAPRRAQPKTVPKWIMWLTVVLAVFLPTVGLTLILIGLIGWVSRRFGKSVEPQLSGS